jgi:hypothetical protein
MIDWVAVTGVATIGLAAVAIWGDTVKRIFYRPTLVVSLRDPAGDRIDSKDQNGNVVAETRYFHANVENSSRAFPFSNVTVSLLRLLTKTPGGQWRSRWGGDIPLQWQHESSLRSANTFILDTRGKTVGPSRIVDLFCVTKSRQLILNPLISPNNLATVFKDTSSGPLFLALDIRACGDQGDSAIMRVEIEWDWTWTEGMAEIKDHLDVKMVELPDQNTTVKSGPAAASPAA